MDTFEKEATNDRLLNELIELRGEGIRTTGDSGKVYDRLHDEGYLRQRTSFYLWFSKLLQSQKGQKLLDVSCGQGWFLRSAVTRGLEVTGIDLSGAAITPLPKINRDLNVCLGNAEQLPFRTGSFDLVVNLGSLEHYQHPPLALVETSRVLKPTGKAFFLLPNTYGLLGNIIYAWRKGDVFDDGQPIQRYGTRLQWEKLIKLNGLRVVQTVKYEREWPRTWEDIRWTAFRPYKILRTLMAPLIPINLATFLVFICRKEDS
jgi:2-polyprenyl-3-methyl-5-hydroxy-6-metoxy-1,4-benzoquinol methylase